MHTHNLANPSDRQDQLRLANTNTHEMPENNIDHPVSRQNEFSDILEPNDPRWLFATRVQLVFHGENRIRSLGQLDDLIEIASRFGFSDIHARGIICIVEEAQFRSGLDQISMSELLDIPLPTAHETISERSRWITFGVLFSWAMLVAGLMQLV